MKKRKDERKTLSSGDKPSPIYKARRHHFELTVSSVQRHLMRNKQLIIAAAKGYLPWKHVAVRDNFGSWKPFLGVKLLEDAFRKLAVLTSLFHVSCYSAHHHSIHGKTKRRGWTQALLQCRLHNSQTDEWRAIRICEMSMTDQQIQDMH
mmetsp:Transcript_23188/g.53824  ORF Transcript_23188/g.53824 Transcript_23188/m.53824 type:complete len:149 (-) Transcript_23188:22-468(-)